MRLWKQRTNFDRANTSLLDEMVKAGLRQPLVDFYGSLVKQDPDCQSIEPVIQRIRPTPSLRRIKKGRPYAGTLEDLKTWKADRLREGCDSRSPMVAPLHSTRRFSRRTLRKRFRTACRVLGAGRLATLTIHNGRHSYISHALAGGRTLAEVRDAVGHANVSITSSYLHVAVDDDAVGNLFAAKMD
jgi:integrase